jgi:hypothetical protein
MKNAAEKFPYVVFLKNSHRKHFDYLGLFLCIASIILFLREIFITRSIHIGFILGVIFILGMIVYNVARLLHGKKIYFSKALLIASLFWLKMPYGEWLFVFFILLALVERQAKASTEIGFAEDRIVFNSLFRKKVEWHQLSNVILKDNLLTIDFKNNHLLQREVEDEEDEEDVTEEEFNHFCKQMLERRSV